MQKDRESLIRLARFIPTSTPTRLASIIQDTILLLVR